MEIRRPFSILALIPALAGTLAGCGALSGLAGRSTASAVDEGLGALAADEQRDEMAQVLGDRELRAHVREATVDIVEAILDEALTEERVRRIEEALIRVSRAAGGDLFGSDFETMAGNLVAQVRPVLHELGHPESREDLALVTHAVVGAMSEAMGEGLREDVGPAAREVIREDVAVGIEQALDERLTAAFGNTARVMAREAVIGAGEGLDEVEQRRDLTVLDRLRGALDKGEDLVQLLVFGLGLLIGLLAAGLVLATLASRRARAKADEKHDALLLVMSTLKGVEDRPWSTELCEALKTGLRDDAASDVVRAVLRTRPDLRLCPGVREQLTAEEDEELAAQDHSGIHSRPEEGERPAADRTGTENG